MEVISVLWDSLSGEMFLMHFYAFFSSDTIVNFLRQTAWPMAIWQLYGPEHILTAVLGAGLAVGAGVWASKRWPVQWKKIYIAIGLILLFSEIYKQLFYYFIVNQKHYQWYLFPFQLCSLPMYLCLWIPWIKSKRLRMILNTFMTDFNVLGAVMVFVDPTGIFHGYWTLTLHGIVWHLLILFVGVYSGLSGFGTHGRICKRNECECRGTKQSCMMARSMLNGRRSVVLAAAMKEFLYGLPVYAITCAVAVGLNVMLYPYGNANLFYLNPYEPSIQMVFRDIAAIFGTTAGNAVYYLATIAGAYVIHLCVMAGVVLYEN